jgi:endoglucanase
LRRTLSRLCLSLVVTLAACAGHLGQPTTRTADKPRLAIRVAGHELVNATGQPVRLLGVVRSGAEYPCLQGWGLIDGPTGWPAIAAMTSWRINVVRIPLNEDCWLGINGVHSRYGGARYRAAIRAYIGRLHRVGLYVILDLHWNAPGQEQATGQQPMADLSHAPAFWSSVARTFKADPAVLFDLYNEPYGISWHCWRYGCTLPAGWATAGMQALVNAVRSVGARQPIIVTGLRAGNDLSSWLRFRPRDPVNQLAAGVHAYNFLSCASVRCWNQTIAPVARQVPVIATELGEADCTGRFMDRFMTWADSVDVSYLGWSWNVTGCRAPGLISSWTGAPTRYGQSLRRHLLMLHAGREPAPG